ncbi:MAG: carboxypeptidase regulatory-like domain-containing protein [Candidatus Bathyarchaeia archaeon]
MRTNARLCVIAFALMITFLPVVQVSAKSITGNGLATLQGMVTGFDQDGDRMPLSWVMVNATSQSFNLTVFTGLNGLYVLVLPPGTYNISTTIQGYQSQSANVTLASGQLMLHDFILRSAYAVSPSPS